MRRQSVCAGVGINGECAICVERDGQVGWAVCGWQAKVSPSKHLNGAERFM